METGHYPLLFPKPEPSLGLLCSGRPGHIHSLEAWAPGFLYSEYLVPSSWAWGCAGPSLGSNQGDLSPGCRRQELPTGPYSVVHTEGIQSISVSKVGGTWDDAGRAWFVGMCKGKGLQL